MDIDENQESDFEPMDYPSEDISANQQATEYPTKSGKLWNF